MSAIHLNLSNKTFGRLTGIEFSHSSGIKRYWRFLCICGNITTKIAANVMAGRTKSCGCLAKETGTKNIKYANASLPPGTTASHSIRQQYIKNAKLRNIDFSLTNEEFELLIKSNCYYCGIKPSNFFKKKGTLKEMYYNGIDRYNNKLGYIAGNVNSCCKICNWAKGKMSGKKFLKYVDRLSKHSSFRKTQ